MWLGPEDESAAWHRGSDAVGFQESLGFGATIKLEELFDFPVATWSVLSYNLKLNCSTSVLNKPSSLKGNPTFKKQKTTQRTLNILNIEPLNKINTFGASALVNMQILPVFYSA